MSSTNVGTQSRRERAREDWGPNLAWLGPCGAGGGRRHHRLSWRCSSVAIEKRKRTLGLQCRSNWSIAVVTIRPLSIRNVISMCILNPLFVWDTQVRILIERA